MLKTREHFIMPISTTLVNMNLLDISKKMPLINTPPTRKFSTTASHYDIDSASKFIGAGMATIGVSGSGKEKKNQNYIILKPTRYNFFH